MTTVLFSSARTVIAGDPDQLLVVESADGRRVTGLIDRNLPLFAWRYRRAVRRLHAEWRREHEPA